MDDLLVVILAAGMGTRMKSSVPKVCHTVGDKTMIGHIVNTSEKLSPSDIVLIVSKNNVEFIRKALIDNVFIRMKIQYGQLGTGHAVLSAKPCLDDTRNLLVLLGDTPLIRTRTLEKAVSTKYDAVVIGFKTMDLSKPYGRIVINQNRIRKIVEYADATLAERRIKLCNSGMLWIRNKHIHLLEHINNNNSKGEYYLTDIVEIMVNRGLHIGFLEASRTECMGVNTPEDLINANKIYNEIY